MNGDEKKTMSWQVVATALGLILMMIIGFMLNSANQSICTLQEKKLDRTEFNSVILQIGDSIKSLDHKMDRLIEGRGRERR